MFCLRRARMITHLVLDVRNLGGPDGYGPLLAIVHQNLPPLAAYHVMVNAFFGVSLDMVLFGTTGILHHEFTFSGAFIHSDSWHDTLDGITLLPSLAINLPDVTFKSFEALSVLSSCMLFPEHGAVHKSSPLSILHPYIHRDPYLWHTPRCIPGWAVGGRLVPQCTIPSAIIV